MKLNLRASTGAQLVIWREDTLFHARKAGAVEPEQICLGVDLFEVIAELAGLDLERKQQAAEALELATEAQRRLAKPQPDEPQATEPQIRGDGSTPRTDQPGDRPGLDCAHGG